MGFSLFQRSRQLLGIFMLTSLVILNAMLSVTAHADYSFNGINYYNPYNTGNPLPNGSPNLPPGYTGAYNPYINQPPGVTIVNPGYAYPMVITTPGYVIQSSQYSNRRYHQNYQQNNNNQCNQCNGVRTQGNTGMPQVPFTVGVPNF